MMMMSETEEVVGTEAQCGPAQQNLPKHECDGTNPPDDLDDNSYVLDFNDVSVESGEVIGNDSGKEIQVCVGDEVGDRFEEEENQIGAWSLVAESDANLVVEEYELRDSVDLESKSINIKEEKSVVECESWDTRTEVKFSDGEVVGNAKPQVSSSTLNLESNPISTKEKTDVAELDFENVSLKKSSGGAVDTAQHHGVPINAPDVSVEVVERESQGLSVKAAEDDEVKLLEGEVAGIAEYEVPSSTSLDLNSELNAIYTKEEVDVVANVVECDLQDMSAKAESEVVDNAEHETLNLVLNPVNAKLSGEVVNNTEYEILDLESRTMNAIEEIDVVSDVVESESQDTGMKAGDEVKFSDGLVENAEHDTSNLESNPENGKLTVEVVKNTEHEILGLELNPVKVNEGIDVVADVAERESQYLGVKAEDEVKLSDEVVENAIHKTLDLESNPVDAKLSGEVVKNAERKILDMESNPVNAKLLGEMVKDAECEIMDLESNPVNSNGEIDVVADAVEIGSQDPSMKAEDEVKLLDEVAKNAEHKTLDLELNPANAAKLSGEVIKNAENEIIDRESNPVNAKLSGEMVKNAELEVLDLESNPVNANGEIDVVADVVELESQDPSVKAEDEVNLSDEVVKNAEHETLDLELNQVNAKLSGEVVNNAKHEILDLESNPVNAKLSDELVKYAGTEILDLESSPMNVNKEIDSVADVVDLESQDPSVKAEDEVKLSDEVVEKSEHETLDLESNPVNANLSGEVEKSAEHEILDLGSNPVNTKLFGEVVQNAEPEVLDLELHPANANVEIDVVADVEHELQDLNLKAEDEVKLSDEVVENAEHRTFTKLSGEVVENAEHKTLDLESNPVNTNEEIDVVADVVELESKDPSVKAEDKGKLSSGVIVNTEHHVTLQPEVHVRNFSAISSGENNPDVNKKGVAKNTELNIEAVEDTVVQIDDENLVLRENVNTRNSRDNNTHVAPPKVEEASIKTKIKPFNFLVRVPRFDDESLREQTRLAKINVDENTKLRGAIQVQIQEKRASTQIHGIDYEYAKGESRNARKLVRLKRIEIDSLQSVINKAKNALSIGDIDSQIYNMEHMIQHETLPLKEEKQLIREIKHLRQLREQLSSNMGSKDEIKQALEKREEVEERLKILRKELDSLKGAVVKAEAAAVEAEKKYDAENKKVKEIQAQFRVADDVRQAAYFQWQSLRKELSKKSEYFYKYKDDSAVASNCVFSKDTDALYRLCTNNVEKFMELWNTNDNFRRDYVKFNTRSTIWRLGTLDGRSLGPDEVPPALPSYVDTRVNRNVSTLSKVDLKSQIPTPEPKQVNNAQSVTSDSKSTKNSSEEKILGVTNKEPAISVQANGSDTVSGQDIVINELHEEPKKSKEEIEAINKAEERERKETDIKLKEERRLEALAKASEARERKKRQAEKLQMRAEMKTIKEAEQKEKEREKRLRKKERKKATTTDVNDTNGFEIGPSSESVAETSKDVSSVAAPKKPKKHWLFGKQSKAKSTIPPPLRNRNKKKLQQWMWVGITSILILVLFLLGNMGVFSGVHFKQRSPVM